MGHTNKEWLYHQYVELGKSYQQIAKETSRDFTTIYYWIKKHNIPARKNCNKSGYELNKNIVHCKNCGVEIFRNKYRRTINTNHYCSKKCKYEYSVGENANNYTGHPVDQDARTSTAYRNWRTSVVERDNYTCAECGAKRKLHVHHLLPYSEHKDLRLDIDNGITLCSKCHLELHRKMRDEDMV